ILSFEDIAGEKKDFDHIKSFIEGIYFGLYEFSYYKSKKENYELEEIEVITSSTKLKKYMDTYSEEIKTLFGYVYKAKDLINYPAGDIVPDTFCRYLKKNLPEGVKLTEYDHNELKSKNFNLIYTVGKGSENKPKLAVLEYRGDSESDKSIALVGKGVTFDSGGTNLKPTGSIETMKTDMAGAATVYAVVSALAESGVKVNIYAYLPLAENTIGGAAYKPGDIIKSYSGKTVEILNTDAEGRLIMADALSFAIEKDPEIVIDIATLTGACVIALGSHCAGLISNRKFLAKNISDISYDISEDIWELPLYEGYTDRIKGKIADLQNISTKKREAGTTIAGLFLREFINNYPWIHLDIAGTAFLEDE
ncbi:MAG TPA: leucyl aminopeptidase, partial [Flexistipes sinusarabici]|nr:leucyl aminopeptidase [Flexistipes sinusarabici]